jgi:hypothetical protein
VPTRDRHLYRGETLTPFPIEPTTTAMGSRTSVFTIVTANTEIRVNDEEVVCVGNALIKNEIEHCSDIFILSLGEVLDPTLFRKLRDTFFRGHTRFKQTEEVRFLD